MSAPLLAVQHVTKRFGGFQALTDVSLSVNVGERFGLIGPNGSGKTTLINCISGMLRNEAGTIHFHGTDVTTLPAYQRARLGIVRTFQIPKPFMGMTILENLCIPLEYAAHHKEHNVNVVPEAQDILDRIGLAAKASDYPSGLTQIDMRKLELARAMAARPKLLIADEVMAGLSSGEVDAILTLLLSLNQQGVTIIMIEHIMRAVMRFSERLAVLDAGEKIAEGTPQEVVNNPTVEKAYLGA
jgi:branched-chain amino acid transport system ATP-binding protein